MALEELEEQNKKKCVVGSRHWEKVCVYVEGAKRRRDVT